MFPRFFCSICSKGLYSHSKIIIVSSYLTLPLIIIVNLRHCGMTMYPIFNPLQWPVIIYEFSWQRSWLKFASQWPGTFWKLFIDVHRFIEHYPRYLVFIFIFDTHDLWMQLKSDRGFETPPPPPPSTSKERGDISRDR